MYQAGIGKQVEWALVRRPKQDEFIKRPPPGFVEGAIGYVSQQGLNLLVQQSLIVALEGDDRVDGAPLAAPVKLMQPGVTFPVLGSVTFGESLKLFQTERTVDSNVLQNSCLSSVGPLGQLGMAERFAQGSPPEPSRSS